MSRKEEQVGIEQPTYHYNMDDLLSMVYEPNRAACVRLWNDNEALFRKVQGSTNNHQAWPGGYADHVREVMNIGNRLFREMSHWRVLPFTLSDALLVLFLHDVEKPWKYELGADGQLHHRAGVRTKEEAQAFRLRKIAEYGIVLTPDHLNGLKYVEGELDDYTNRRRVMGPLAAFCHMCDVASARIWHDHPLKRGDTWFGARRSAHHA